MSRYSEGPGPLELRILPRSEALLCFDFNIPVQVVVEGYAEEHAVCVRDDSRPSKRLKTEQQRRRRAEALVADTKQKHEAMLGTYNDIHNITIRYS